MNNDIPDDRAHSPNAERVEYSTVGAAEEALRQAGIPKVDLRYFWTHGGMDLVNQIARNILAMKSIGIPLPDQIISLPPAADQPAFTSPSVEVLQLNPTAPIWDRPFAEQLAEMKDHLTPSIRER